ncbi:hypothetical protein Ptr902_05983 [Pyrenophora tritici-repentis]|nr:hypothetical protein Ptr902_05983 [Pyrenophora tritici-repentis]
MTSGLRDFMIRLINLSSSDNLLRTLPENLLISQVMLLYKPSFSDSFKIGFWRLKVQKTNGGGALNAGDILALCAFCRKLEEIQPHGPETPADEGRFLDLIIKVVGGEDKVLDRHVLTARKRWSIA